MKNAMTGAATKKARAPARILRARHDSGDADATLLLGQWLLTGQHGAPLDPQEGISLLYRLAINPFRPRHICAAAKHVLGEVYRAGMGVQRDPQRAVEWYEDAIRSGLVMGAHYVGWWYSGLLPNWSAPRPDLELAERYFAMGAAEGCAECAAGGAMLHLEGLLPKPDESKGLRMLHQAAKAGHPVALGALKRVGPAFAADASHGQAVA